MRESFQGVDGQGKKASVIGKEGGVLEGREKQQNQVAIISERGGAFDP